MSKENSEVKKLMIDEEIERAGLDRGVIVINKGFDSTLYEEIKKKIEYLVYIKNKKDILIEINSPGGVITDGLAIYDKILEVEAFGCRVHTLVTGSAASMGAALLSMGTKGCRYAYPNSTVMIHQPLSGYGYLTKISDLKRDWSETSKTKEKLTKLMADKSNINFEQMEKECDRDNYMSSERTLEIGLIDKIITSIPELFLPEVKS